MIKKIFVILFICISFTTKVFSYDAEKISISNSGAYIQDINIIYNKLNTKMEVSKYKNYHCIVFINLK